MDEDIDFPVFSRGQKDRADALPVDVRLQMNPSVVALVDARCHIEGGKSRSQKLNEILYAWAKQQEHEATVLLRAMRGNASLLDTHGSAWTAPESAGSVSA